jgi:2-polyprenyl-3-methyl-5-hydroxy-6-metoxy-1,4-benzoquinol methylase
VLVEPNLVVHQQLREAAGTVKADIVPDLADLESPAGADTVALIHVLDHLTEPVSYLRDLRRHLAPDAHILVVVHNEASTLRRLLGVRWPPFTLQHPQLFNPETLRMTLEAGGFDVIAHRPTTNVFPARHVVRTAGALVGLKGRWIEAVPNLKVRIRLGNMMAVASS